jgi:hypothetical protein
MTPLRCDSLTHLTIKDCESKSYRGMEAVVGVSREDMARRRGCRRMLYDLVSQSPNLTHFTYEVCDHFDDCLHHATICDKEIGLLASLCPHLKHLHVVSERSSIIDKTVIYLSTKLNLEHLFLHTGALNTGKTHMCLKPIPIYPYTHIKPISNTVFLTYLHTTYNIQHTTYVSFIFHTIYTIYTILPYIPYIYIYHIYHLYHLDYSVYAIAANLPNLTEIGFNELKFSNPRTLRALHQNTHLQRLSIKDGNVSEAELERFVRYVLLNYILLLCTDIRC